MEPPLHTTVSVSLSIARILSVDCSKAAAIFIPRKKLAPAASYAVLQEIEFPV